MFDNNSNKHSKYLYSPCFTTHYFHQKIFAENESILSLLKIRKLRHREILYVQNLIIVSGRAEMKDNFIAYLMKVKNKKAFK